MTPRLKELFHKEIQPALKTQFGLKNLYRQNLKSLYQECLPKLEHNFYAWRKVAKDQYAILMDKVSAFVS